MKSSKLTSIIISAVLVASSCNRLNTHSKASVERAINTHLAENRHLKSGSFQTRVETVAFNGDNADAVVRFESRDTPNLFVEVKYGLRLEKGEWQVVSSVPMSGQGGDSHGSPQDQSFGPPPGQPAGSGGVAPQPSH